MENWRTAIEHALQIGRFFVGGQGELRIVHHPRETIPWEVFHGHLLDASRTRQRQQFEAWDVLADVAAAPRQGPLLSVKYAAGENQLFVVRYLQVHAWEAFEASPGVIEGRPVEKAIPELVGTLRPVDSRPDASSFAAELSHYLYLATVGTSRLPITSLESPLPPFSLGQWMYLPAAAGSVKPTSDPLQLVRAAAAPGNTLAQRAKLVEAALRAIDPADVAQLAAALIQNGADRANRADDLGSLLRTLISDVALSPYTDFVPKLMRLFDELAKPESLGVTAVVDVLSFLLRQLTRHLTAYDLTTFHNSGANYPDALLLDEALKRYLRLIERFPDQFTETPTDDGASVDRHRVRRRALRQACLLRDLYEGHPVPDAPTSSGENERVLPKPYRRVPEEQLTQPQCRRATLYEGEPLRSLLSTSAARLLRQSIDELQRPAELRELGVAIYLDRPLGLFKQPGEVDRTPLVSYEAFSRQVAVWRLEHWQQSGWLQSEARMKEFRARIEATAFAGYSAAKLAGAQRPGVVALEDARLAADDFLFLKTTRRSLGGLLAHDGRREAIDSGSAMLPGLREGEAVLLIRTADTAAALSGQPFLTAFDHLMQPRLAWALGAAPPPRYRESWGIESLERPLRQVPIQAQNASE